MSSTEAVSELSADIIKACRTNYVSPFFLNVVSASVESLESDTAGEEGGLLAVVLLMVFWGFGAGNSLLNLSSTALGLWMGGELIMGLLRDREDSVSVCSKKTYFTARSRARPRVITCSRSMLVDGEERFRVIHQWVMNRNNTQSILENE